MFFRVGHRKASHLYKYTEILSIDFRVMKLNQSHASLLEVIRSVVDFISLTKV